MRVVVAAAVLLLPVVSSAQRLPTPGRRPHPASPQPMPREPEPVARRLEYTRLHFSVESYPQLSFVQSAGFASGGASTWTSLGAGAQLQYRFTRLASATLDLTSSLFGGPVNLQTVELGTRLARERTNRRLEPFADLRLGYSAIVNRELDSFANDPIGYPIPHGAYGSRYSNGWGGVAGVGVEYGLTRMFSLTTEVLGTHASMSAHDVLSPVAQGDYGITSVRWVVGAKFNPVRTVLR